MQCCGVKGPTDCVRKMGTLHLGGRKDIWGGAADQQSIFTVHHMARFGQTLSSLAVSGYAANGK